MTARGQRIATLAAACLLVGSVATVAFIAVNPTQGSEPFTEFYVLNSDGNASNYPSNLTVGETGELTVGVANHEHEETTYTVVALLNESTVGQHNMTVADGSSQEEQVTFTPQSTGTYRLRLLLFAENTPMSNSDPYRRLRLWISVSEPSNP